MTHAVAITATINGSPVTAEIATHLTLADFLRDDLELRGTKIACDQGSCGACTVLVDGRPVSACLTFAFSIDGCNVLTIEGIARDDHLSEFQQSLLTEGAPQCGYCTPGFVLLMAGFLEDKSQRPDEPLEAWLNANLCRCSGYHAILRAARQVDRP